MRILVVAKQYTEKHQRIFTSSKLLFCLKAWLLYNLDQYVRTYVLNKKIALNSDFIWFIDRYLNMYITLFINHLNQICMHFFM